MSHISKSKMIVVSALAVLTVVLSVFLLFSFTGTADAAIYIDDTKIEGYEPQDIISTDMEISTDTNEVANNLENTVVRLIRTMMPFLMIACVGIIVFNAGRNLLYFRQKEKQVPMGDLIKNMFVQFFFILFAFIIVEGIVFIVTGGQTLLFSTILG